MSEQTGKNGRLSSAIKRAAEQFESLTGKPPESVSGVRKAEDGGWSILIDVVELERIPSTTSVIGTYRVDVDQDGDLLSYERLRRFHRGTVDHS